MKKIYLLLLSMLAALNGVFAGTPSDVMDCSDTERTITFSTSNEYEWTYDYENQRLHSSNQNAHGTTSTSTITIGAGSTQSVMYFDYGVSSEEKYDKLTITIDGRDVVSDSSGEVDGYIQKVLTAGSHTVVLSYVKDGSLSVGEDCAYISNFVIADAVTYGDCGTGVKYVLTKNGTLRVYGWGAMSDNASSQINCSILGKNTNYIKSVNRIIVEEGVTSIGESNFDGLKYATSVKLPSTLESIGEMAFDGCESLSSVKIPSSVTKIKCSAFDGCSGLTKAEFGSIESLCNIEFEDDMANPLYYANHLYVDGKEITSVSIPSTVNYVPDFTFVNCYGLVSVTIPSSVKDIGVGAFSGCVKLIEVWNLSDDLSGLSSDMKYAKIIHNSLDEKSIISYDGDFIFYSLDDVQYYLLGYQGSDTNVILPETFNGKYYDIASYAFASCRLIKVLDLPQGISSIGDFAFANCSPDGIICRAIVPPSLGNNNIFYGKGLIIVPGESLESYKSAWSSLSIKYFDYLPITDVMFLSDIDKSAYQAALDGKTKSNITSVALYCGIDDDLTESAMKEEMNPNCLYLLSDETGMTGENIISANNLTADYISLTDNYPFHCPVSFKAKEMEYIHNPSVWATGTSGWETICLPFTANEFEANESGSLWPILIGSSGNFWLRKYVGSNSTNVFFSSTTDGVLEANTPYLVAFPGKTMGEGHLEGQTITFRGYDADVPVICAGEVVKNQFSFVCNYDNDADDAAGWILNAAGNSFVESQVVGNEPFRAYFKHKDGVNGSKNLKISFGTFDDTTGIFMPEMAEGESVHSQDVYDMSGRKLNSNSGVKRGIYIVNGKKMVY